jgi:hypothetical protein
LHSLKQAYNVRLNFPARREEETRIQGRRQKPQFSQTGSFVGKGTKGKGECFKSIKERLRERERKRAEKARFGEYDIPEFFPIYGSQIVRRTLTGTTFWRASFVLLLFLSMTRFVTQLYLLWVAEYAPFFHSSRGLLSHNQITTEFFKSIATMYRTYPCMAHLIREITPYFYLDKVVDMLHGHKLKRCASCHMTLYPTQYPNYLAPSLWPTHAAYQSPSLPHHCGQPSCMHRLVSLYSTHAVRTSALYSSTGLSFAEYVDSSSSALLQENMAAMEILLLSSP